MSHRELTVHRQAYEYCTFCPKMCRFACPVSEASKTEAHSTWGKMTAAGLLNEERKTIDAGMSQALHACTGCGRCQQFCKHNNDVASALFAARGEAITKGVQPTGAASTLATFAQSQNPFGHELGEAAKRWRADAPVRYPLFPGCSSLVKRPDLIEDTLAVTAAFGVPVGVTRVAARCCGYPLYAAGAIEQFVEHARSFVETLSGYPELAVLDPGCAFTLKVVYPRFGVEMPSQIHTVTQLLADNLEHAPKLAPLDEAVGYHDACHLGRGLGEYEAPRQLLHKVVSSVREAPAARAEAGCAGGGGLLPRTMPEVAVDVAKRQAREVAPQGETVVSACATSTRMFERSGRKAEHVVSLLKRWLTRGALKP